MTNIYEQYTWNILRKYKEKDSKIYKKIKGYLLKSYMAIEEVSKLKYENCRLKDENRNLKDKNQNLTNYIEKTFEVVKYLFNFPKASLKTIIHNFINNDKKY